MRRLIMLVLAVLALLMPQLAAAQSPAPRLSAEAEQAWLAWTDRFTANLGQQAQQMRAIMTAFKPIEPDLGSQQKMQAHLPRLQAIFADAATGLARTEAELIALRNSAPPTPPGLPISLDAMIGDALKQGKALNGLLNAMQDMLKAAAAGDAARVRTMLPKVAEGAVLLMDNQAAIYRTRSALFAEDRASSLAMALFETLYDGMGNMTRIAIYSQPVFQADVSPARANLVIVANNAAAVAKAGSAQVTSDMAELDRAARLRLSPADAALLPRLRQVKQSYAALFAIGNDLASELTSTHALLGKGGSDVQIAGQAIGRLAEIELRAISAMQQVAGAATQK